MSSSPTSGVLPSSCPPTGDRRAPKYDSIRKIVEDIQIEIELLEFELDFFFDPKKVKRSLYLNQLVNYWLETYLVLYGEKL